jgi:hypothetical protein
MIEIVAQDAVDSIHRDIDNLLPYPLFTDSGDYHRWRDVQERAMAPGVFLLHKLPSIAGWTAFHLQGRKPVLRQLLWRSLRQEMQRLRQADHWWVGN